jgi:hypothetical protein
MVVAVVGLAFRLGPLDRVQVQLVARRTAIALQQPVDQVRTLTWNVAARRQKGRIS